MAGVDQTYQIDFSSKMTDLRALADSRLLSQFQNSTNLKNVIYCFIDEIQELLDEIIKLEQRRTLYDAGNNLDTINLDAIGRIVGQPRENIEAATFNDVYFQPDHDGLGADVGLAYVRGGRVSVNQAAIDSQYKDLILGRIFANANKTSSIPYLIDVALKVLGLGISFEPVPNEPMAYDVIIYQTPTPFQTGFLTLTHPIVTANNAYYMPYPACLRIRGIVVREAEMTNIPGIDSLPLGLPTMGL